MTRIDESGAGPADTDWFWGADEFLSEVGFDAEASVLTRLQAKVLVMREHGLMQAAVAERLGTSRANVSGVEASARENVEKARETVAFAELLSAPVRIEVPAGTELYDVPDLVFGPCDEAGVKVAHGASELIKLVSSVADDAVRGRTVRRPLVLYVTSDGTVRVQRPDV